MNLDEYAKRQQSIVASLASLILRILWPFRNTRITKQTWPSIERAIYPGIERARRDSARVAREFYDSQRLEHMGERRDALLAGYKREWLTEALRPVKKDFLRDGPNNVAIQKLIMVASKEAENGGRRQIMDAVRDEPFDIRWARIATGRETCGFCWMMISRGPVYMSAESAGLNTDDTSAKDLFKQNDFDSIIELMTRWHTGCDCLAVPVFNKARWPGKEAYERADRLWKDITKGYSGLAALNKFRQAIEDGELNPKDFSAISA